MTVPSDPSSPGLEDESVDLAIVEGAIERTPWDRWTLQQVHRALAPGGALILVAPNFYALTSPADLVFLAQRALREGWARLRRAAGLGARRQRFRGRRFRRANLEAMLESVGLEIEDQATAGFGWLALLHPLWPRRVERHAQLLLFRCRRIPSLFGRDARPYPDPDHHRTKFEAAHREDLERRRQWLKRHPDVRTERVEALDPAQHRGASILVLSPHPDDELIGCGGTLKRLIDHGARVTCIQATDGSEAASLWHAPEAVKRTVRLEEAQRVADLMGFESLVLWREDNAAFRHRPERVRELAEQLMRLRPTLVFVPFITDVHPDHRVLSRMLAEAIREMPAALEATRVLNYQVWSLVPPNLYCDISEAVVAQERALLAYETAMKVDDYVHFCQDRNFHDAVVLTGRPGFVEAFFAIPARAYPDLVAADEESHG